MKLVGRAEPPGLMTLGARLRSERAMPNVTPKSRRAAPSVTQKSERATPNVTPKSRRAAPKNEHVVLKRKVVVLENEHLGPTSVSMTASGG